MLRKFLKEHTSREPERTMKILGTTFRDMFTPMTSIKRKETLIV